MATDFVSNLNDLLTATLENLLTKISVYKNYKFQEN